MGEKIYHTSYYIAFIFYLICLVISLRARKRLVRTPLNNFFWYPMLGTIVSLIIIGYHRQFFNKECYVITMTSSVIFHYVFLSRFIYLVTNKNKSLKTIVIIGAIIVLSLIVIDIYYYSTFSSSIANILLLTFCLYYFYYLFKAQEVPVLYLNSEFIMCCGIFLGTALIIPFSFINKYLPIVASSKNVKYIIPSIGISGHLIMIFSFCKALLWKKYQRI